MVLFVQAKLQVEVMFDLHIELSLKYKRINANMLTLNTEKTTYIVFGTRNQKRTKPHVAGWPEEFPCNGQI